YIPYIVIALCLIYPLRTVIYNQFQTFLTKNKDIDVASAGGFIPFLRILHAEQGATVTSKLPFENTISVVNSEVMKATLHIGDRPIGLFKFLRPLMGEDNIQVFDAERAERFRKLSGSAFVVLVAKYDDMRNVGIDLIKRWEESLNSQDNIIIRMQEQCLEFSLRATSEAILSSDMPHYLNFKEFKRSYDTALSGMFDKQFGLLDDGREKEFQQSLNTFLTTLSKLINDRKNKKKSIEEDNLEKPAFVKDLLDILLTENDPETGCPFSDEMIRSIISVYLTAGYHTTGVAIPFTLFALTQNPKVKARLQEEIDDMLQDRLPTFEDLSKMDYLTQVIKEALRIHTPATFCARLIKSGSALPKVVENLQKVQAADNTTILYCIPLYHENPSYFANPKKFDPSRFSQENIRSVKPNTYCPFGFGARMCPAERLAMVDVKMMVCMIVQKFDVELAMKMEDVQMEERFVVMAKNDILIKLKPRSGINA
ncbi:15521_t:CDS:2, partial [Gigaspora rosea]